MSRSNRKVSKLFFIIPLVICVCITLYFVANVVFSPYWGSVYPPDGYLSFASMGAAESDDIVYTNEQACEDMDYILNCLSRVHPLFIDGVPDEVQLQVDEEKNSWGETVTTYELWQSVARVFHSLGDSHTMAAPSFPRHYLTDYISRISNGYRLTAIDGKEIGTIFIESKNLFSYELEAWGLNALENCFQTAEGLAFIGCDISDGVEYTYLLPDGTEEKIMYTDADFLDYDVAADLLDYESEVTPDYYYEIQDNNNLAVFTLTSCTFDSDYKETVYNFFTEVTEKNIGNVVVDLRDNAGGNSTVADEFILYLDYETVKTAGGSWRLGPYMMNWEGSEEKISHYDEMLFDGNLYLLTSSGSFSSATIFAEMIADNGFGTIVGEPCGNMPDSYGEVVVFQTPNALISFQVSSKHFDRIDESKSDDPVMPDYECSAGEALDVVMSIIEESD